MTNQPVYTYLTVDLNLVRHIGPAGAILTAYLKPYLISETGEILPPIHIPRKKIMKDLGFKKSALTRLFKLLQEVEIVEITREGIPARVYYSIPSQWNR